MPYLPEWLTLAEAIERIREAGESDPLEALRRACSDGNVPSRGLVQTGIRKERSCCDLGPEWWHPGASIDLASGRIIKGPITTRVQTRALTRRHDRLGPEDWQTIDVRGNDAESVQVSRGAIDRIWPARGPANGVSWQSVAPSILDEAAQLGPGRSSSADRTLQSLLCVLTERRAPRYEVWDHVDALSVGDAACLLCDEEPEVSFGFQKSRNPSIGAYEALIVGGIKNGMIDADHSGNALHMIGDYAGSLVRRVDLISLAEAKGLKPKFLFPEVRSREEINETGKIESAGIAGSVAQLSSGPVPDRSSGVFSRPRLRQWYMEWIAINEASRCRPSRDEDWTAAKNELGHGVPRDPVWKLRRELAPESWTKKGRRKTVGDKSVDE